MQVTIAPTYEEMSRRAADDLIALVQKSGSKLVCIASGDTPSELFKEIVTRVSSGGLHISDWKFIGLDEWGGMNGTDEGSCRYHLNRQFFSPLQIKEENIFFFNGHAADLQKECEAAENYIQQQGGIDVAILGLGLNGHIGMNEPGTSSSIRTHISQIDALTQKTGQKYFSSPKDLSRGITLGLANLMEANAIILLANGSHKAPIVKKIVTEEISEKIPATLLQKHPNATLYLDEPAAALLE